MNPTLSAPVTMLGATNMPLPERVSYAGTVTLLGMLVIFAVLSIVWLAIVLMRMVLNRSDKTPVHHDSHATAAPVPVTPPPVPQQPVTDDGAILAAITAAIAVVWESEHPNTGFRVVSYRHLDARKPWNTK